MGEYVGPVKRVPASLPMHLIRRISDPFPVLFGNKSRTDSFLYTTQQNFDYDEVKGLIDKAIEPVLGSSIYQPAKVHDWTSAVVEGVLKNLSTLNKPFKYVGACSGLQCVPRELAPSICSFDSRIVFFVRVSVRLLRLVARDRSYVYHHAKERRGAPHCKHVLLGHQD